MLVSNIGILNLDFSFFGFVVNTRIAGLALELPTKFVEPTSQLSTGVGALSTAHLQPTISIIQAGTQPRPAIFKATVSAVTSVVKPVNWLFYPVSSLLVST